MTDDMAHDARKARLKGAALAVDKKWKRRVLEWVKENGTNLTELGKKVGLSQSGMSRLLNGSQPTSRAAKKIADVTGVELQDRHLDEDDERWMEIGSSLRRQKPEEYERFVALLETMSKKST